MTPIQQQVQQLTRSFNSLLASFKTHIHNGVDSQKLSVALTGPIIYKAQINGDGTTVLLPTNWSVARTGAGNYVVTHNLGVSTYTVDCTCKDGTVRLFTIFQPSTVNFTVLSYNPSFSGADCAFYLTVFN